MTDRMHQFKVDEWVDIVPSDAAIGGTRALPGRAPYSLRRRRSALLHPIGA